ncbi:peptidoglycan DD-metalloendopeptidase family protein [Pararhodobacter aggregans]|uniref:peptidoglycan DD-metalloendopeptidase family protein n=1 Tax=Pararhodobacter aggregans TaxID=404875 RepID=UPI003A92BBE8
MSRQHLAIRETSRGLRLTTLAVLTGLSVAGCSNVNDLDWDLRPSERFSTTDAARNTTGSRPAPDGRGVISYPGYQVVVAQRGERVADIAARLGLDATSLANHNAIAPDTALRGGELLVLPSRVGDGSASTPITSTPLGPATPAVAEPLRHTVDRGETAFTIARLYNVSPRSIAEWNGLPADMSVREGQILVIPVPQSITAAAAGDPLNATGIVAPTVPVPASLPASETTTSTTPPGQGSPTPVPPSAATPLPQTNPAPAGQGASQPAAPVADMAGQRTQGPRLGMPVQGRIIRAYAQGRNDGVGIGAPAGTEVHAAAAGTVAAITQDTDQVPIMVIRHENNLLTVYANIDGIRVARGDRVSRGQTIATVRSGDPSFLHFEVREGFESVDPMPYLQ